MYFSIALDWDTLDGSRLRAILYYRKEINIWFRKVQMIKLKLIGIHYSDKLMVIDNVFIQM